MWGDLKLREKIIAITVFSVAICLIALGLYFLIRELDKEKEDRNINFVIAGILITAIAFILILGVLVTIAVLSSTAWAR